MTKTTKPLLTPKFLTADMAEVAAYTAIETILDQPLVDQTGFTQTRLNRYLQPKRKQCHIVVLVPGMVDDFTESYPNWPVQPVLLYEVSNLDGAEKFEAPFDDIARSKALQLWTDRNDDRTDCIPHLLFPGDTPYWGGVKRRGIVVTCSGVEPYNDKLISGMVADLLVAMSHAAWKASPEYKEGVDFLS